MNEPIHRPEIVDNTYNAAAYFIVACFVTCGALFLLSGMVAPIFLGYFLKNAGTSAHEDSLKNKGKYEDLYRNYKIGAYVITALWFIFSWGIFIFLTLKDRNLI